MTSTPHQVLKSLQQNKRTLERARIQVTNRLKAIKRDNLEVYEEVNDINQVVAEEIGKLEKMVDNALAEALYDHPLWDAWLSGLYGVGPSIMPQILALLLPPLSERGPSTWFKAAGLIPEETTVTRWVVQDIHGRDHSPVFSDYGECVESMDATRASATVPMHLLVEEVKHVIRRLPRARAGGPKLTHHQWLRRCLWLQSRSFVMTGKGYYREWYDKTKNRLTLQHQGDPEWPAWRIDASARWSMMRLFLSHTWEMWLLTEGKSTDRKAYVVERLGHTYIAPPQPKKIGAKLLKM